MQYTPPTTDEVDRITPDERKKLVAFCDRDEEWWKFEVPLSEARCPICGNLPGKVIGFQPMTQRTYRADIHGKKKAKKRR